MNSIKSFFRNLWKDESGQGTAEYVLLIAIVVALIFAFKDRIKSAMGKQINEVGSKIEDFSGN